MIWMNSSAPPFAYASPTPEARAYMVREAMIVDTHAAFFLHAGRYPRAPISDYAFIAQNIATRYARNMGWREIPTAVVAPNATGVSVEYRNLPPKEEI